MHASHPGDAPLENDLGFDLPHSGHSDEGFVMTWYSGPRPCLPRGYVSTRVTRCRESPITRSKKGGLQAEFLVARAIRLQPRQE